MQKKQRISTKTLVLIGMCTAVLCVLSQIAIPMPTNVPLTLQTFAVALVGCVLGAKLGTVATLIYILLGAVGIPVFAEFSSGFGKLFGYSGGFIFGFILLAFLCGVGMKFRNRVFSVLMGFLGIIACHIIGVLQFSVVSDTGLAESFVLVSLPYLIKDGISIVMAVMAAMVVKRALAGAGVLVYEQKKA